MPRFVVSRLAAPAGLLPQLRAGARAGPGRGRLRRARRPGRPLAPGQARRRCSRAIGDARLVYSDAADRRPRRRRRSPTPTGAARRNNHADLLSLLVANSVTGAASLFRRELLDDALPFPPAQFAHYHDHWIGPDGAGARRDPVRRPAAVRLRPARRRVARARRRQPDAVACATRLRRQRSPRERVRMWRLHYFVDVCRLLQFATILRMRCGERMRPRQAPGARALRRRGSLAGARWRCSAPRRPRARGPPPRRSAPSGCCSARSAGGGCSARAPATGPSAACGSTRCRRRSLVPRPGRAAAGPGARRCDRREDRPARARAVVRRAPARVNLLIPTIDLEHFFGGYIAQVQPGPPAGRARAARADRDGRSRRRRCRASGGGRIESYEGLDGLFDRVEVAFGREAGALEVSRSDAFIATTWWTAHIAGEALARALGARSRFLYLIQEYEPFTFPMGTYAALAAGVLRRRRTSRCSRPSCCATISAATGSGSTPPGRRRRRGARRRFENAITAVPPPTVAELAATPIPPAAVLRPSRAARRSQHVRARACWR